MIANCFTDEEGNQYARLHFTSPLEFAEVILDSGIAIRTYDDGHMEVYDTDGDELFVGSYENLVGLKTPRVKDENED